MEASMSHGGNVWEDDHPEKWLDFSANLRAGGVPEWVNDTFQTALKNVRYYPDREMRAARCGLAVYAGVGERTILSTAGGIAAIDLALSLRKGNVFISPPTFGGYEERARAHEREIRIWRGTCMPGDTVVLCNPNNPTGQALSRAEILKLHGQICAQGGELLVDEAFIDYCPENSVRDAVSRDLLVVGSLTKTLGIPGVRLGYLCADEETIDALSQRALSWSVSALASAVAAALKDHIEEIRRDSAENALRRDAFAQALRRLDARVFPSAANFLLVDFGRDMTEVVERLKKRSILVRTCQSFGLGTHTLRLAVKTDEENTRFIDELREVLLCAGNR